MKDVVIIGGGFGGLSAARRLAGASREIRVTLLDRKATFDFLPLLPDIVGGRIPPAAASLGLDGLARRHGFAFHNDSAEKIDPGRRAVIGRRGAYPFDALLVAAGSEPNYFGDSALQNSSYSFNSCRDSERLAAALSGARVETCVIAGGGYTGIEMATHIRRRFARGNRALRIIIVEASASILGAMPDWIRRYARGNLARLDIGVMENCRLAGISGGQVRLSSGAVFERALAIWCAGVQAPAFVRELPFDKGPQGRLLVNSRLEINGRPGLFAIGDSAAFMRGPLPLRMSVQFARAQGARAAGNIVRYLQGGRLRDYRPFDPGFVLPMANGRSCGAVGGLRLRGLLPTALHYVMSLMLSPGWPQKARVLSALLNERQRKEERGAP